MTPQGLRIFIGWDPFQMVAWNVARASLMNRASVDCDVAPLTLSNLHQRGLYWRPMSSRASGYWDDISGAPMATQHAITRFLVPLLCDFDGWALFADGDILVREDIADLFALADPSKAVQVVQHQHAPVQTVKMEGQTQTIYHRKNWSSVMLWHAGHPANRALTAEYVNRLPGRDLHRFCWLSDDLIGALPARWNVLIGEQEIQNPAIAHFTLGVPNMPGYEHQPYADEWYAASEACGYHLGRPPAVPVTPLVEAL